MKLAHTLAALALAGATTVGFSRPATAGICLDDEEIAGYAKELERYASGGKAPSAYWLMCLKGDATFQARVTKACTTIVAGYDPTAPVTKAGAARGRIQQDCVMALAHAGVTQAGAVDTVAALLTGDWGPRADVADRIATLAVNGDVRARRFIVARLSENLAAVKATPLKGWKASAWITWQRAALRLLDKQGTAADVATVDAILAGTRDKALRRAATKTRTALAARP